MVEKQTSLLSPRRIAVTGTIPWSGSELEQCFCSAVGERIVERDGVVVTLGGKANANTNSRKQHKRPIDEHVVHGALDTATQLKRPPEIAIETLLAEGKDGRDVVQIGRIRPIRGRTYEAQRFRFVDVVDGVIGIGGGRGTEQTLILGMATERPVLPVATFGGASAGIWKFHEADLTQSFGIESEELGIWKRRPQNNKEASALAKQMVDRLLSVMVRRCFIVMPFQDAHTALYDFVIAPAVEGLGDEPIRLDRMAVPGDVGQQIASGIRHADYVIVVLDGMRPNILYELGLAHGQGKPTILMNQTGRLGTNAEMMPFDLALQQRLEYVALDRELPKRLQESIRAIGAKTSAGLTIGCTRSGGRGRNSS